MSEITPFNFEGSGIRWTTIGGEAWFAIADLCRVLDHTNPTVAADRLESDDLSFAEVIDSMGRMQRARVTNESGLYELIIRSNKPDARRFRRWITSEVLPSLRKTGEYKIVETEPDDDLVPIEQMIHRLRETRQRVGVLEGRTDVIEAKVSAVAGEYDEFTALAYAKLKGLPTDRISCQRHGQRATAEMKRRGGAPRKVQDATFGMINIYPLGILDETAETP
jgi:prophage antirepressor-like protein